MKNFRLGDKFAGVYTLWCDDEQGIPRPVCTFTEFGFKNFAERILDFLKSGDQNEIHLS